MKNKNNAQNQGEQSKNSNQPQEIRREFPYGFALSISGIYADIDIALAHGEKMSIMISGPAETLEKIELTYEQETVSICSAEKLDDLGKVSIKISAPEYTEVNAYDFKGNLTIGKLCGDVRLRLSGQQVVQIASVRQLSMAISDKSRVVIEEVSGRIDLVASGDSKTDIHTGYADTAKFSAQANAEVDARITVGAADLTALDMSRVHIRRVNGGCGRICSNQAKIAIG